LWWRDDLQKEECSLAPLTLTLRYIRFIEKFITALFAAIIITSQSLAQSKEVFGYVERLHIREASLIMLAKLDTGADTSSIHARQLHEFEKDGAPWVRFEIRNFQGEVREITAPVVRVAKIKRPSGPAQRRIVIKLGLCLGEMFQEEFVSINDRTKFDYQFLLGRSFLAGNAIVDPSAMYVSSPNCATSRKVAHPNSGVETSGALLTPSSALQGQKPQESRPR
jgi:hypothetical protein